MEVEWRGWMECQALGQEVGLNIVANRGAGEELKEQMPSTGQAEQEARSETKNSMEELKTTTSEQT